MIASFEGANMPDTFGDYELYEELGHGATATVYRGLDTHTGQIVALKVLQADDTDDPERLQQRLALEARIANQLDHRNIVRVYEHSRTDGKLYIAMEFVNGETLKTRLRREGRLAEAEVHRITLQIA
jgi:serine/threonine-protein kinase